MTQVLSPNTQAILLLTAPLIAGRNERSSDILTPGEYKRLARVLRDSEREPADLIAPDAAALVRAAKKAKLTYEPDLSFVPVMVKHDLEVGVELYDLVMPDGDAFHPELPFPLAGIDPLHTRAGRMAFGVLAKKCADEIAGLGLEPCDMALVFWNLFGYVPLRLAIRDEVNLHSVCIAFQQEPCSREDVRAFVTRHTAEWLNLAKWSLDKLAPKAVGQMKAVLDAGEWE